MVLASISFLLMGCANDSSKEGSTEKIVKEESRNSQTEITEETNVEEAEDKDIDISISNQSQITFTDYRPKAGATKLFYDQVTLIFTEKIIAVNDQYVQRVIELGNAVTVQVLKWTEDEITIVYESFESANPTENILDTFTPSEKIQPIVNAKGNNDIKVLDTKASIEIPHGMYNQVLVVKKATHEVENAETFLTYYFAPGVGIIKESYELTGEQGYQTGSELQEIK